MNYLARASLGGFVLLAAAGVVAGFLFYRSPFVFDHKSEIRQPVQFYHRHHVEGLGLDCRYCHTSVEESGFANIPPIETCMTCHSQIWTQAESLEPVRDAWSEGTSIAWNRVSDVPDFVYFNHSIHVNKGIGCVTCHGRVSEMAYVYKPQAFFMSWCLDCHREPEKYIRPRDQIFNEDWDPEEALGKDQLTLGAELVEQYDIYKPQLTNCSVCHR
jgi:ferredoxin